MFFSPPSGILLVLATHWHQVDVKQKSIASLAFLGELKGQQIPITKKGAIFRKKLEEVFGDQLTSLINGSGHESEANVKPTEDLAQGKTKDQVANIISNIVVETLRISADILENNSQSTFAEVSTFFSALFYLLTHLLY